MMQDPDMNQYYALNEPQVITDVIDGESVIMNLGSGTYYGLDALSSVAWQRLLSGEPPSSIARCIAAHFDIPHTAVLIDTGVFIANLIEEDLLVTNGGPRSDVHPSEIVFPAGPYTPPRLSRYADMTRMLALDPPLPS